MQTKKIALKNFKKGFFLFTLVALVVATYSFGSNKAYAQDLDFSWLGVSEAAAGDSSFTNLESLLGPAVNIFLGLALSASVISMLMAGIKYTMAKGDIKATAEAKQALTYSVIAFILAAGAFTIKDIIVCTVGGQNAAIYLNNGCGGGGGGRRGR